MRTSLLIGSICVGVFFAGFIFFGAALFKSEKSVAATTFTTLSSGSWTNNSNVWSTNGITPCNCNPGTNISATVFVNHNININTDLIVNTGGNLTVSLTGKINSSGKVQATPGTIVNYGTLTTKELIIDLSGNGLFYGPVSINSKFIIGGTVILNSSLSLHNGNIEINPGGIISGGPIWDIYIGNGNLYNSGSLNLSGGCLKINNGNFDNSNSGVVTGNEGYIEIKTGNISNNGMFGNSIKWCAGGQNLGMVNPSNCIGCVSLGVLPITLIDFVGNFDQSTINLSWTTGSELNNDNFTIERSVDGINFSVIGKVNGSGTSNTNIIYSFNDPYEGGNNLYYRLSQTDYDGTTVMLKTILIKPLSHKNSPSQLKISPNPFTDYFTAQFEMDEIQKINVQIINLTGALIYSDQIISIKGNNLYYFSRSPQIKAGTYLVRLVNENSVIYQEKIVCL